MGTEIVEKILPGLPTVILREIIIFSPLFLWPFPVLYLIHKFC